MGHSFSCTLSRNSKGLHEDSVKRLNSAKASEANSALLGKGQDSGFPKVKESSSLSDPYTKVDSDYNLETYTKVNEGEDYNIGSYDQLTDTDCGGGDLYHQGVDSEYDLEKYTQGDLESCSDMDCSCKQYDTHTEYEGIINSMSYSRHTRSSRSSKVDYYTFTHSRIGRCLGQRRSVCLE